MKIRTRLWIITILPFVFFLCGGLIVAYTNHLIDMENEKTHIADDLKASLDDLAVLTHEYVAKKAWFPSGAAPAGIEPI